jgi:hypothetical protein
VGKALLPQQHAVTQDEPTAPRSLVPAEKTAANFLPHSIAVFVGGVVLGGLIGGMICIT